MVHQLDVSKKFSESSQQPRMFVKFVTIRCAGSIEYDFRRSILQARQRRHGGRGDSAASDSSENTKRPWMAVMAERVTLPRMIVISLLPARPTLCDGSNSF